MSALLIHAQAARILGDALADQAVKVPEFAAGAMLDQMAQAYRAAADRMEAQSRAEAAAWNEAARCHLDHKLIKGPRCPACGAPKG